MQATGKENAPLTSISVCRRSRQEPRKEVSAVSLMPTSCFQKGASLVPAAELYHYYGGGGTKILPFYTEQKGKNLTVKALAYFDAFLQVQLTLKLSFKKT